MESGSVDEMLGSVHRELQSYLVALMHAVFQDPKELVV